MSLTQQALDTGLNRTHTLLVEISPVAPLPAGRVAYDTIRQLPQTGFQITPRALLHAIGCKTAALPSSETDHCLRASLLYTYILDLESPNLCFLFHPDSDLQTPRSQEIGIGMLCLLASERFNIPWDQLGSLPGRGLRFDYRGRTEHLDAIFESKGTSHRGHQTVQLADGVKKKDAHHDRGDRFDVELIVSTFIGRANQRPRVLLGDPNFDGLKRIYHEADDRFFRLRHYARVLQFVGLPKSAFQLNRYAKEYLKGQKKIGQTILDEKAMTGYLSIEILGTDKYFGRWFTTIAPEESQRYPADRYEKLLKKFRTRKRRVFQGIREDVYRAGFEGEPFSQKLLSESNIQETLRKVGRPASLFPDGTIQIFDQD